MCGIAGIYNFNTENNVDERIVRKMTDSIIHRGPDDVGYFINRNLGMGHRRLSIIDLKAGHQPMMFGDLVIVFNGEIYNYVELRDELKKLGYQFSTSSDTEVLLKAYHRWGVNCFSRLNGDWALVIYNLSTNTMIISRDRYGIKPIYYHISKDSIYFASEIKALSAVKDFSLDIESAWDLMVYGPKPGGSTHLAGLKELTPGCYITIEGYKNHINSYYFPEEAFYNSDKYSEGSILELLVDSVKKRLMSEVKLCSINSGGLDSSFVTALAIRHRKEKLYTFNVAPAKQMGETLDGDESFFAELLAKKLQLQHRTIRYNADKFLNSIQESQYSNGWLMYHSNTIPLDQMFKEIKNTFNITVALGGEGADEVFSGYSSNRIVNTYFFLRNLGISQELLKENLMRRFFRLDEIPKEILRFSFPIITAIARNSHVRKRIADSVLGINGSMSEERLNKIYEIEKVPADNHLPYYEQQFYLSGLLHRVDHISMKWGVEARVPFLDHRLVDMLNSTKRGLKSGISEHNQKKILKKIAKPYLPSLIVSRKKYGFATPLKNHKSFLVDRIKHDIGDKKLIPELSDKESFLLFQFFNMYR